MRHLVELEYFHEDATLERKKRLKMEHHKDPRRIDSSDFHCKGRHLRERRAIVYSSLYRRVPAVLLTGSLLIFIVHLNLEPHCFPLHHCFNSDRLDLLDPDYNFLALISWPKCLLETVCTRISIASSIRNLAMYLARSRW